MPECKLYFVIVISLYPYLGILLYQFLCWYVKKFFVICLVCKLSLRQINLTNTKRETTTGFSCTEWQSSCRIASQSVTHSDDKFTRRCENNFIDSNVTNFRHVRIVAENTITFVISVHLYVFLSVCSHVSVRLPLDGFP